MFNLSESFTQDFLAPPSPPQSQSDDAIGAGRVPPERSLGKGVLHATIATLHNLGRQKAFDDSDIKAFGLDWSQAIIVGWITDLDGAEEGVLTGQICDGTGTIDFRYELASDMPEAYNVRLARLGPISPTKNADPSVSSDSENIPIDENVAASSTDTKDVQIPTRMIGNPTMMNDELLFVASHLKAATADEVISTHFLECGLTILRSATIADNDVEMPVRSAETSKANEPLGVDPYFGEEVDIPEEIGAFMKGPENRIKRVIWRYLDEASRREFNTDKSESCVAIRSFCGKMWKDKEVETALDSMDEDGILYYMDASKTRVALV